MSLINNICNRKVLYIGYVFVLYSAFIYLETYKMRDI